MRVVIERNAHANTRGASAPELLYLSVAVKVVEQHSATPTRLDNATAIGREILAAVDDVPGVDDVSAERYQLAFTIARAFDADAVLAEVLQAIERVTGESVEQ